jgi:hypothetical protein
MRRRDKYKGLSNKEETIKEAMNIKLPEYNPYTKVNDKKISSFFKKNKRLWKK